MIARGLGDLRLDATPFDADGDHRLMAPVVGFFVERIGQRRNDERLERLGKLVKCLVRRLRQSNRRRKQQSQRNRQSLPNGSRHRTASHENIDAGRTLLHRIAFVKASSPRCGAESGFARVPALRSPSRLRGRVKSKIKGVARFREDYEAESRYITSLRTTYLRPFSNRRLRATANARRREPYPVRA